MDHLSSDSDTQQRFKDIARERYLISKHTNTSFNDTQYMSPIEREFVLEFVMEELQKQKEIMDAAKEKANKNKR